MRCLARLMRWAMVASGTRKAPAISAVDRPPTARVHVLYLIFNEGYTATSGTPLVRAELTAEAIRLARQLHRGGARQK